MRSRAALAIATSAMAAAVMAPAAWAGPRETFCVHQPGDACVPAGAIDEGADLQSALDAALSNSVSLDTANVVDIGPGTFDAPSGGFTYLSHDPLQIVGSGAGRTTLTGSGAGPVLSLGFEGAQPLALRTLSVSDLSIATGPAASIGLLLQGGSADHLDITASQGNQVGAELVEGALSSSSVSAPGAFAAVATKNAQVDLSDDTIDAADAWGIYTDGPTTIHRATVSAQYGLRDRGGPAYIDDSLIIAQYGLYAEDFADAASINALNDTVVAAPGASVGVAAAAQRQGADVQVFNSIVRGFPSSFETIGGGPASVEGGEDNYDGQRSGSGVQIGDSIGSDPRFIDAASGDYRLASDSPLIDASSMENVGSASSTSDLDGNPRVVAVDHPATPVDLGAYEYQPPAAGGGNPGGGGNGGGNPGAGGNPGTGGTPVTGGNPSTGGNPGAGSPGTGMPGSGTPANGSRPSHHRATVKLTALGHVRATGRRISLRLWCAGTAACSPVRVTATAMRRRHRVTVGSLTTRLAAGRKATLTLTLNRTGRALLASTGRLKVALTVTVRNGSRTRTVQTARVTLT
jgi:hypothetical protein